MDKEIRVKMVKAMEFIACQINDEEVLAPWLSFGVADGDIEYADLSADDDDTEMEILGYYIKDKNFSDLMDLFVHLMARAKKSGGLFCDGIVSDRDYPEEEE